MAFMPMPRRRRRDSLVSQHISSRLSKTTHTVIRHQRLNEQLRRHCDAVTGFGIGVESHILLIRVHIVENQVPRNGSEFEWARVRHSFLTEHSRLPIFS